MAMMRTPKRVRSSTTVRTIVIATTQRISDHLHAPMNWLTKLVCPLSGIGDASASFDSTSTTP